MKKTINIDFDNSSSILLGYQPDILSSAATGYAFLTHTHGNFSGINITCVSSASNGLTLSVADPSGQASNAVYVDGPYLSRATLGVSTTIGLTGVQPAGAYLTTAALSDHDHGFIANATGMIGGTISHSSWSVSIPDFVLTENAAAHTHNYAGTGISTAAVTGTRIQGTLDSLGLSMRVPNFLTTAALSNHTHGTFIGTNINLVSSGSGGLAVSVPNFAGTQTSGTNISLSVDTRGITAHVPEGRMYFEDANNVIWGTSGSLLSTTITASYSRESALEHVSLDLDGLTGDYSLNETGMTLFLTNSTHNHPFAGTNTSGINVGLTVDTHGITASINTDGLSALGDGVNIIAAGGNTAGSNATIEFANSNGIAFGLSNDVMTASYTQSTHDHATLPFAASDHTHDYASSNHTHSQYENNIYSFHDVGGLEWELSTDDNTIHVYGSVTGGGGGTGGIALQQGANILDTGTVVLSNQNGISFGLSSNTLTASYNSGAFIGTEYMNYFQATSDSTRFAARTHTHGSISTQYIAGNNVTHSSVSSGLTLGFPVWLTTAAPAAHSHGSVYTLANTTGSDIRFTSASSGLTAAIPPYSMTNHTHSNLYAANTHSHGNVSLATANLLGAAAASASSGLTISISGYPAGSFINTSQIGDVIFADSLNTNATWTGTVGVGASSRSTYVGVSAGGGTGGGVGTGGITGYRLYGNRSGTTSNSLSDIIYLSGGPNITLSGSARTIVISAGSASAGGIGSFVLGGNTTGISSVSGSRIQFVGGDNVTLSGYDGSNIRLDVNDAGKMYFSDGSGVSFGVSTAGTNTTITGSVATGSVYFVSSQGNITWSSSYSSNSTSIYGNSPVGGTGGAGGSFSAGVSNLGNTFGSTRTVSNRLVLAGGNNISLSQSTNASGATVSIIGGAGGGGGIFSAGASNLGHTSGNTGTVTNRLVLVGSNNITLSQATNAQGATISFFGLSGGEGGNVGLGLNTSVRGAGMTGNTSGLSLDIPVGSMYFGDGSGITFGSSTVGLSTTITASFQEFGNIYFSDGDGVSFGISSDEFFNTTVTGAIGAVATMAGSMRLSASNTYRDASAFTFANSNNMSFYLTNNQVVGSFSYTQSTHAHPYLGSTYSNHGHAFSASGGSSSFRTLSFANGNGITFSNNGGSVQINHSLQYLSNTSAITAGAMHTSERARYFYTSNNTFARSTHIHGSVSLALSGLTGTYSSASSGLTLSLTNTGGGGMGGGIAGIGNTATQFTSGNIMMSGRNITVTPITTAGSQILEVSSPDIGFLVFSNIPGFSWSTNVNGMSTVIQLRTS